MSNSFRHKRDFRQSRTDVVVRGVGTECVDGAWVNGACVGGTLRLIWARYTAHADAYPCRYLTHGWGGEPYFNADIGTVGLAEAIAEAIGSRAWGALGQLLWRTDMIPVGSARVLEIEEGDVIELTNAQEGQDHHRYPVLEVTPVGGTVGHPVYEIVVGERAPDFVDMIGQMTAVVRVQEAIQNAAGGGAGDLTLGPGGAPSAAALVSPSRAPGHSQRNAIQPQFNDTVGLTIYANPQDRDRNAPLDPLRYERPFQVTPPPTTAKPRPEPRLWASHDGEAHPYTVDFGYIAVNGTYGTHLDYPMQMRRLSIKGTGTVTLQQNGVAVAGPFSVSGSWTSQVIGALPLPPPAPPPGIAFLAGDDLHVVVSGAVGTGVSVKVSERVDA